MIEPILFFALGFLCAGILALMVAPAIWRRAVNLTRRRIEASVPLTANEIHAEKDKVRAEFAMSTRRLEMNVKGLKEKTAEQIAEIGRNREELRRLAGERDQAHAAMTSLEGQNSELKAELRERKEQIGQLTDRLVETDRVVQARALELERMGTLYEEATFASSGRQIELVARESEVDQLTSDLSRLKTGRRDFDRRLVTAEAERKLADEALAAEKKRVANLEGKLQRLHAKIADGEELLERREKELARLRAGPKGGSVAEVPSDPTRALTRQASTLPAGAKGDDLERVVAGLQEDRARMETRLGRLASENKKLRTELSAHQHAKTGESEDERRGSALLREKINDLAAEVVSMTIALEGPNSPIATAINKAPAQPPTRDGDGKAVVSLADRVRALRKAAASR